MKKINSPSEGSLIFPTPFFLPTQELVAPPPKNPQTLSSKPARRLVYRLSRDSRYLVIHLRRLKVRISGLH